MVMSSDFFFFYIIKKHYIKLVQMLWLLNLQSVTCSIVKKKIRAKYI